MKFCCYSIGCVDKNIFLMGFFFLNQTNESFIERFIEILDEKKYFLKMKKIFFFVSKRKQKQIYRMGYT